MSEKRIAVIGLAGKWSSEVLADALAKRTGFRLIVDMGEVVADLREPGLYYQGHNLCELDGLIVKKISAQYSPQSLDRLEMLRLAEACGVRVFSPVASMLGLVNRLSCTFSLHRAGIPMPDTLITEDVDAAVAAVKDFGAAVFKPLFSTKARGMQLIDAKQSDAALRDQIEAYRQANPVMYLQRKLELPGRDLGMIFLNGQYRGSYARVAAGDAWNTTIHSGGRYAAVQPPADWIDMAQRAQAAFKLDFTTVDVAQTDAGPVVFEVSAFGGFRGALEGAGFDAASAYAEHALSQVDS